MFKMNLGYIKNPETGEGKDIIVNALSKKNVTNFVIGSCVTAVGIGYLMLTAFKNGAMACDNAQLEALTSLNLM